jgi:hypothetical protein
MDEPIRPIDEVRRAIDRLVEEQRSACLWFAPRGFVPANDAERLVALQKIEQRGDRVAFVRCRELRDWLLQASNET